MQTTKGRPCRVRRAGANALCLAVACVTAVIAVSAAADARDGLKFWWKAEKKTAIGAALEAREFPERVTYSSAASPAVPIAVR